MEIKKRKRTDKRTINEGDECVKTYITMRISEEKADSIDQIASETKRTRSQVARLFMEHGLANYQQGYFKL